MPRSDGAMSGCKIELNYQGHDLVLYGEKALYIKDRQTLVMADLHLGKARSFRARNFFAPDGLCAHDLARLQFLIETTGARRLMILGDMVHAADGLQLPVVEAFTGFRERYAALDAMLVLGNHDKRVSIPDSWRLDIVEGAHHENGLIFVHEHAAEHADMPGLKLSGHLHPAVRLIGGKRSERVACFWFSGQSIVLPSFGSFTGYYVVQPSRDDRVFAIADGIITALL